MKLSGWRLWAGLVCAVVIGGSATGCSAKFQEHFKDTPVTGRVDVGAVVGSMPDGFNNWARTCDGTTAVYTAYHGDAAYGSVSTVADSPVCGGGR